MLEDHPQLTLWLSTLGAQLPFLVTLLVAGLVLLARGDRLGAALPWALLGCGLLLVTVLASPTMQILVQRWTVDDHLPYKQVGLRLLVLSVGWSALTAAGVVALVVAILTGRPGRRAGALPPLPIQRLGGFDSEPPPPLPPEA